MKQKLVIKVEMHCGKCRKEAMKIAASTDGVILVVLQGKDKDQIVVVGNEVDSVDICTALRKKTGGVTLLSVEEVKDPKPEDKKNEEQKKKDNEKEVIINSQDKKKVAVAAAAPGIMYYQRPQYSCPNTQYTTHFAPRDDHNNGCNIL